MDYANINTLYAGSLRIKISYCLRNLTFYKWCGTNVAHYMNENEFIFRSME